MKLTYVTRVNVPGRAAQSVQIEHMSRAFHSQLGDGFRLVASRAPGAAPAEPGFAVDWRAVTNRPSQPLTYASFVLAGVQAARHSPVFTRDIAAAAAVVATGGTALYELHRQPETYMARRLTRWLAGQKRAGFVSISQALADYYMREYRLAAERVIVAHDGAFPEDYARLDDAQRRALRDTLGLPQDKLLLLHTGSVYKGGAELFGDLVAPFGDKALFVHLGGSAAELAPWRQHYAKQQNIELRTQVSRDESGKYQQLADYLVYINTRNNPLYWCTSPLKLFEYMASGVPIIGTDLGSVGEVLNEELAFCFDANDPASIRAAATRAVCNPGGATQRAAAARQAIEMDYSWHIRAERILAFANRLAGSA